MNGTVILNEVEIEHPDPTSGPNDISKDIQYNHEFEKRHSKFH